MKNVSFIGVFVVAFVATIDGCKDVGSDIPTAPIAPMIVSIHPDSAAVGDTVTINGNHFGTTQGNVYFAQGIAATVILSWKDSSITVKVPAGTVTGNVSVSVNGATSNGLQFKSSAMANTTVKFDPTIELILSTNCAISGCHKPPGAASGFDQSSYSGIIAGGAEFGKNDVVAGDSTNSKIIQKLRGKAGNRMPLTGTYAATGLPDSLIVKIGIWIMQGAQNN
jgi:IPT/TIG domain